MKSTSTQNNIFFTFFTFQIAILIAESPKLVVVSAFIKVTVNHF